jgi:peroxiredoxin
MDNKLISDNLPAPKDDGAARHLINSVMPDINLLGTDKKIVNLKKITGQVILYCYPLTANPSEPLPADWDLIPGARGCTPQNCSYRDNYNELKSLGVKVFGISTQETEYQKEMVDRLHLPHQILSDSKLELKNALNLPTFTVDGMQLLKRLTLIISNGVIEQVFYPIFPSNSDVNLVIDYLNKCK